MLFFFKKNLFAHFKLFYFGYYVCKHIFNVMFSHIWCAIGRCKRPFCLMIKIWRAISNNCLFNIMILIIPSSQIEIERVFFIKWILIGLCQCWLGVKNLDILVLIIKYWLDDPTIVVEDKEGPQNVDGFGERTRRKYNQMWWMSNFLIRLRIDHVEDCVQNWDTYPWFW